MQLAVETLEIYSDAKPDCLKFLIALLTII
jgi:hypothetical protein